MKIHGATKCFFLAVVGVLLWLGPGAFAQESTEQVSSPAQATANKLDELTVDGRTDLVARLSDEQIRDLLLYYLGQRQAGSATGDAPVGVLDEVEQKGALIRTNAGAAIASLDDIPLAFGATYHSLAGDAGPLGIIMLAAFLAFFVAAGLAAEWLYSRSVARLRQSLNMQVRTASTGFLLPAFLKLLLDLLGIAIFATGFVLAFLAVWQGNEARRQLTAAVLAGFLVVRLTRSVAEFFFAPETTSQRLMPLDQPGARYFQESSVRVAIVGATVLIAVLIGVWSGDRYVRLLLVAVACGVFVAYFGMSVWQGRHHVSKSLAAAGDDAQPAWFVRLLAQSWAGLVIVYAVVLYLAMVIAALAEAPVNALSFIAALLLVVVGIPVADNLVRMALSRDRRRPASEVGASRRGGRVSMRAARIVIAILVLLIVLRLFGVDLIAAANETLGGRIARLIFDIGVIALVAYVLWEIAIAAINRKLAEETAAVTAHGTADAAKASRLTTILPIFRRALQGTILAVAGLMVVSSLGVDIGPLLAGAGIFGLAIGFGSQTLVKDVMSGLFFLLDDAFRVGEYIEVGSAGGNVERINTRSLSLRKPDGAIYTVPFGDIQSVANFSRDWAIVKMEFRVTYDTNLGKVKRIFRRIGEELLKDPELAPGFIQPFKFQGVKAMEETGIIVRGKFMAVPGTQFQIRKQVFERVQKAFADEGISFAQRRVQVDLPPGLDLDEPTKDAISRAAAASLSATEAPSPAKA